MVRKYIDFSYLADGSFSTFLDEFQGESDRASAVLGAAFLDYQLERLLSETLIFKKKYVEPDQLFKGTNPLSSFSSRMKMCYAMGLLNDLMYYDLNIVRDIRNDFSHMIHGLSFNTQSVRDRCNNFKGVLLLQQNPEYAAQFPTFTPRFKFDVTVALNAFALDEAIKRAERLPQRKSPDIPVMVAKPGAKTDSGDT